MIMERPFIALRITLPPSSLIFHSMVSKQQSTATWFGGMGMRAVSNLLIQITLPSPNARGWELPRATRAVFGDGEMRQANAARPCSPRSQRDAVGQLQRGIQFAGSARLPLSTSVNSAMIFQSPPLR